jgi:hypothetical protein
MATRSRPNAAAHNPQSLPHLVIHRQPRVNNTAGSGGRLFYRAKTGRRRETTMFRTIATALAAAAICAPAAAQTSNVPCYPIADIERELQQKFGEQQRFSGRASNGTEFRIYANADSGTWTLVGVPGNSSVGCFVLEGQSTDLAAKSPEAATEGDAGKTNSPTPLHRF